MRRLASAGVLFSVAILMCVGCGRNIADRAVAQSSPTAVADPVSSPATPQLVPSPLARTTSQPATPDPGKTSAAPPTPAAAYPQYASGTTPAPATVSLASSCVVPGGKQTISVVSEPNFVVGYDAQYADSKDGRTYGGMDSNGRVDSKGYYSSTWIVAPTAPVGQVTVWVAVGGSGETAFRQPTFQVKASC